MGIKDKLNEKLDELTSPPAPFMRKLLNEKELYNIIKLERKKMDYVAKLLGFKNFNEGNEDKYIFEVSTGLGIILARRIG